MNFNTIVPAPPVCRRSIVPACDPVAMSSSGNPSSVGDEITFIKKGDIIDVGLDWSKWLEANGGKILESEWAAHGSSPQAPTFSGDLDLYDGEKKHTVVVIDASGAAVGDIYYVSNTVTIRSDPSGSFTMPDRTLTRTMHIKVSA